MLSPTSHPVSVSVLLQHCSDKHVRAHVSLPSFKTQVLGINHGLLYMYSRFSYY